MQRDKNLASVPSSGETWVCDGCMRTVTRPEVADMVDGEHVLCRDCERDEHGPSSGEADEREPLNVGLLADFVEVDRPTASDRSIDDGREQVDVLTGARIAHEDSPEPTGVDEGDGQEER